MRSLLNHTRQLLPRTPRGERPFRLPPLTGMLQQDALVQWGQDRDVVWRDGDLRWGCLLTPPRELMAPGGTDHPVLVVVASEAAASPELLHIVALRLADLLRQGATDPAMSEFEARLQLGVQGLSVPVELGGTLPCRVYTVIAHRDHLPLGHVRHHLVPVLVERDRRVAMILPAPMWSPRWRDTWERGFDPPAPQRAPTGRVASWARQLSRRSMLLLRGVAVVVGLIPFMVTAGTVVLGVLLLAGAIAGVGLSSAMWLGLVVPGVLLIALGVTASIGFARSAPVIEDQSWSGVQVSSEDAHDLWKMVREIEGAMDVIPVEAIVVDRSFDCILRDMTAAHPFARTRQVLVIGLPLMLSVSPTHLRALVIHALIAGQSGWVGVRRRQRRHRAWVQGLRRYSTLHPSAKGSLSRTVARWMRDWAELYEAVTAPLARQALLHADRLAASHVGAQTFADALVRVKVLEGWWATRWDGASFQGSDAGGPVPRPVARWRARGPELNPTMARLALTACLRAQDHGAAQASIGERLRKLDVRGRLIGEPPNVACNLLGPSLLHLIDHVDDLFAVHFGEVWRSSRHASMRAQRRRDALASLAPERRSLLQHLELIGLCTKLDEPYLAAQHALEAATIHPKEPDVRLKAGMTLLEVGDDQGLVHLRAATDLDPGMAPKACAHAMRFLKERNMRAEMEAWGEVWSRARGQLSQEEVRNTPRIVLHFEYKCT